MNRSILYLGIIAFVFAGLHTAAATPLAITPTSATLDSGQNITFTTNGAATWSVGQGLKVLSGCPSGPATNTICTVSANTVSFSTPASVTATAPTTPPSGYSGTATATVTVDPALINSAITPASPIIDSGQSIKLTANPTGGTGPYTYTWSGTSASCTTATCTVSPTSNTVYYVKVTDASSGNQTTYTQQDSVTVYPSPSVLVSPVTTNTIDMGQSVLISATPSGGTGNFLYSWAPATRTNCPGFTSSTTNAFTYTPTTNTLNCEFTVTVTDNGVSAGATPSGDAQASGTTGMIKVNIDPTVSISPKYSVLDSGVSETYTFTVYNGIGSFQIELFNATGNRQVGSNAIISAPDGSNTITFTANALASSTFTYNAIVTDTGSNAGPYVFSSASNTITVNPALNVSVSPEFAIAHGNHDLTLTANVSGGTTPYTYNWFVDGNTVSLGTNSTFVYNRVALQREGVVNTSASVPDNVMVVIGDSGEGSARFNSTISHTGSIGVNGIKIPSNGIFTLPLDNVTLKIISNSSSTISANVMVANDTGNVTSAPSGKNRAFNKLTVLNISVSSASNNNLNKSVTLNFGGLSVNTSAIAPYILSGSTWTEITPFTVNTITNTITFSIPGDPIVGVFQNTYVPPPSNNYGGSYGGTGGGESGGGGPVTTVTAYSNSTENGWRISQFAQDAYEIVTINGTPFNVVENYMTSNPGTAGVTVNGNSYSLNQGTPVLVSGNYYLELMNVSWAPILHSVTIDVYEKIAPKAPAPSSNSTGSTNATKKAKAPPPAVQQNTTKSTGNATSAAAPAPTNAGRHPNSAALPVAIGSGVAIAVAIAVAASRRRKPQAAASKGRGNRKDR